MGAWGFIKKLFSKRVEKEEVPAPMTFSCKGMDLLKRLEGVRLKMYRDPAGHPTIGIGHKLTERELTTGILLIECVALRWKVGITAEQAEALKRQDVTPIEEAIRSWVRIPINQNQFDALVCLMFNIGINAFRASTLLKKINRREIESAATEFIRWDKITLQNGEKVRLHALTIRRQTEAKLWLS